MSERNARRVADISGTFQTYGEVVGVGANTVALGGGIGAREGPSMGEEEDEGESESASSIPRVAAE